MDNLEQFPYSERQQAIAAKKMAEKLIYETKDDRPWREQIIADLEWFHGAQEAATGNDFVASERVLHDPRYEELKTKYELSGDLSLEGVDLLIGYLRDSLRPEEEQAGHQAAA
jgi:hypothetical protein